VKLIRLILVFSADALLLSGCTAPWAGVHPPGGGKPSPGGAPSFGPVPPDTSYGADVNVQDLEKELGADKLAPLFQGLGKAGIGYVRIALGWNAVERQAAVWDFQTTDQIVRLATQNHLRILAELGSTPAWDSTAPPGSADAFAYPPKDWPDWMDYVTRMAERYNGVVTAWKVMNEPYNLSRKVPAWTAPAYAQALGLAYQAVHTVEPDATVISGCVWWHYAPNGKQWQYFNALVDDPRYPLYRNIDAFNLHLGQTPPDRQAVWLQAAHREMARDDGGRQLPIWVDETAYPADRSQPNNS